jgi:hypothetical protein
MYAYTAVLKHAEKKMAASNQLQNTAPGTNSAAGSIGHMAVLVMAKSQFPNCFWSLNYNHPYLSHSEIK